MPNLTIPQEIAHYLSLPVHFDGHIELTEELRDSEIFLICTKKGLADPERGFVPSYHFAVCKGSEQIGQVDIRIGYNERLYYGGNHGYGINEAYRGNGYAARAVRLLAPIAKAHGMTKLLISNDLDNIASARVCEKLGAKLLRVAPIPAWHDLAIKRSEINIWEWTLD